MSCSRRGEVGLEHGENVADAFVPKIRTCGFWIFLVREIHPIPAQHEDDSETAAIVRPKREQAVVGGVKHPSLCPLVEHVIDALHRDERFILRF